MTNAKNYGLEQARNQLPSIVAEAKAGYTSVISKHGKPCAAVVPLADLQKMNQRKHGSVGILDLQGSGRGLWGSSSRKTLKALRGEWE